MNKQRTLSLKKEFFEREGIEYSKGIKRLINQAGMKKSWRRFKKAWKDGIL